MVMEIKKTFEIGKKWNGIWFKNDQDRDEATLKEYENQLWIKLDEELKYLIQLYKNHPISRRIHFALVRYLTINSTSVSKKPTFAKRKRNIITDKREQSSPNKS
jgi:hypothetical protein